MPNDNIFMKLQKARVLLQNKKLKKSGKNKFAGFDYFELSDFLPTINQIFDDLKIFSCFNLDKELATLSIVNAEMPEERVNFTTPTAELELKGCNAIQALGGINTYCKRYLYLNALEIVEADMFDGTSGGKTSEKPKTKPVKQEQPTPPQTEEQKDDIDIYAGLDSITDEKEVGKYFLANKNNVNDCKAFIKACNERKAVISDKT